jgi:hypothetical protein
MGTGWAAGGTPGGRRRLGEVLVAGRVLTETQLDEALRVQREDKGRRRRLGEVIVALGLADEVQIARALPGPGQPAHHRRDAGRAPP